MDKNRVTAYLTHMFTTHFPTDFIDKPGAREVKLWLCPNTGMPSFSSGGYGGPTSSLNLPIVGYPTIHIRPTHFKVNVGNDVEFENQRQYEILFSVYMQIYQQIEWLILPINTDANLYKAMAVASKLIDTLLILIYGMKEVENEKSSRH